MTSYFSSINGENQAKLKDKSRVRGSEDTVHCDEEVRHDEGCCSPWRRGSWMKKPFSGSLQQRSPSSWRRGSPRKRGSPQRRMLLVVAKGKCLKYKYQSRFCHDKEALSSDKQVRHGEDCCLLRRRENICFYPSFESKETSCKTQENFNFLKNGKFVILVKTRNVSKSWITKRISPLESSREI